MCSMHGGGEVGGEGVGLEQRPMEVVGWCVDEGDDRWIVDLASKNREKRKEEEGGGEGARYWGKREETKLFPPLWALKEGLTSLLRHLRTSTRLSLHLLKIIRSTAL